MTLADKLRKVLEDKPKVEWRVRPEILLHPNVPKPLHSLVPRNILGAKWWKKTREAAFRETDYHCAACGVQKYAARYHAWLEGHEQYSIDYLVGRATYIGTVGLCHFCHNYIHGGRLKALLEKKEIHHAKYAAVIQHGDAVLQAAGLKKPEPYSGPTVEWSEWRLILFDKEYEPLYKTFDEWRRVHGA